MHFKTKIKETKLFMTTEKESDSWAQNIYIIINLAVQFQVQKLIAEGYPSTIFQDERENKLTTNLDKL